MKKSITDYILLD
jgi:hypothetical protein